MSVILCLAALTGCGTNDTETAADTQDTTQTATADASETGQADSAADTRPCWKHWTAEILLLRSRTEKVISAVFTAWTYRFS